MSAFVDSYLETVTGSVSKVSRSSRQRNRGKKLMKLLADKKNVLVTSHMHPDPDALASSLAMTVLLTHKLPHAKVTMSIKGPVKGGVNEMFIKQSNLQLTPWDDAKLAEFDAIVLLDAQPLFATSPLPPDVHATAVVDHHRSKGRHPHCPFCDIRIDVGATSSIVFAYFLELEVPIDRNLAALLLYAIESDLAGAAGTPGELDNVALSSLTLLADTRKLYQMRYADIPQSMYIASFEGMKNAVYYESALVTHVDDVDSPEKLAIVADWMLRFEPIKWALVTGPYEGRLVLSLRTADPKLSAGDMIRHLLKNIGEGGGHRTKAGGFIKVEGTGPRQLERLRNLIKKRLLRRLGLSAAKPKLLLQKDG
jgi:nanoRNase/pAp phosphatase (c-di-AMP/oligoRNAs hydrolase)